MQPLQSAEILSVYVSAATIELWHGGEYSGRRSRTWRSAASGDSRSMGSTLAARQCRAGGPQEHT